MVYPMQTLKMTGRLGMKKQLSLVAGALLLTAGSALALVEPPASPLADKEVRLAGLDAEPSLARIADLPPGLAADFESRLTVLGLDSQYAIVDTRGLHWATLWLKRPLIPGGGVGNDLTWNQLGHAASLNGQALGDAAWNEFVDFLRANRQQLGIDPAQLEKQVGIADGGDIVQIHAARQINGVPVRGAAVVATINHGNLILLGTERWGTIGESNVPTLTAEAAIDRLGDHLAPAVPDRYRDKPRLELLPVGTGGPAGQGWSHRLAWILEPEFDGLGQRYEAAIDAHNGSGDQPPGHQPLRRPQRQGRRLPGLLRRRDPGRRRGARLPDAVREGHPHERHLHHRLGRQRLRRHRHHEHRRSRGRSSA